jgi:hypothetical protein
MYLWSAFAKLQKKLTLPCLSVPTPVPLSVYPHGTTRLPLEGFISNLILSIFRKFVEKIQIPLKYDMAWGGVVGKALRY